MTDHSRRRYTGHPIAKRPPAQRPPRIEEQVRRGSGNSDQFDEQPWGYGDGNICDCFPRTSKHTIPSMFYDKITCPHMESAHIQPAQETQFNYPWTADSISRQKARGDDDELSERLSLISEEDEQLRFSPHPLQRNEPDVLSIQTAPPYWYKRDGDARDSKPPFTAPTYDKQILENGPRAQSMQDIRNPAYRTDGMTPSRALDSRNAGNRRNSRLSNRQFTGTYLDPRNGKAYNYNVNYNGTPNPVGTRQPVRDTRKPTSAI